MSKLAKDLQKISGKDLQQKVTELRKELVEQKRARAAGELMNAHAIKKTRRSIAIALTQLRQAVDNDSAKKEETK
jgi:ribosomal protein L29